MPDAAKISRLAAILAPLYNPPNAAVVSVMTENPDGSITHDDGQGNTVTIPAPVAGLAPTLTEQPDGSFDYDDGAGNITTIPAPATGGGAIGESIIDVGTAPQVVYLTNGGPGTISWTAPAGGPWLITQGISNGVVTSPAGVVDTGSASSGTFAGVIQSGATISVTEDNAVLQLVAYALKSV